ncbi:MAG: glycosyltransferase family 2 protein [Endomicrobiia bacterium]
MTKYSIVIISKNNREKLIRLLDLLDKSLKGNNNYEIVVVEAIDDLSDLNYDISHIKIPLKEAGFSYQRNIGVKNAKGDFVIFIDDDVEITKDWFKEITKPLPEDKFGVMGAVFPKIENVNLISFVIGVMGHPGGGFRLHNYSRGIDVELSQVATCNTIFRKKIIEDVGMFNLKNRFGSEDSDLCLRIIKKHGKNRFLFRPNALVYHDTNRNLFNAIKWYIRRGKADIDLLFIDMVHLDYVLKTSILVKFLFFLFIGFILGFKVFLFLLVFWYLYQIYKYFFMVKYFKFYNFGLFYKIIVLFLFPLLKFIFDFSFDIGRIIQTFSFLKNKI